MFYRRFHISISIVATTTATIIIAITIVIATIISATTITTVTTTTSTINSTTNIGCVCRMSHCYWKGIQVSHGGGGEDDSYEEAVHVYVDHDTYVFIYIAGGCIVVIAGAVAGIVGAGIVGGDHMVVVVIVY